MVCLARKESVNGNILAVKMKLPRGTTMSENHALSSITLQDQLYEKLYGAILSGTYQPGDKLPSENDLCKRFGVSRVTVRAALAQLVSEGLITKRQGKGAFVQTPVHVESDFSDGSFTTSCLAMGSKPSTKVLSVASLEDERLRDSFVRGAFGEECCIRVERLRYVDDEPCILERDYLPQTFDFAFHSDLEKSSLLRLILRHTGRAAVEFDDQFRIVRADGEQANSLACKRNHPLLEVSQKVRDGRGELLYINQQLIVTEKYVYAVRSSH